MKLLWWVNFVTSFVESKIRKIFAFIQAVKTNIHI